MSMLSPYSFKLDKNSLTLQGNIQISGQLNAESVLILTPKESQEQYVELKPSSKTNETSINRSKYQQSKKFKEYDWVILTSFFTPTVNSPFLNMLTLSPLAKFINNLDSHAAQQKDKLFYIKQVTNFGHTVEHALFA